MPVLGTSPTDPDFYASKIARASQLLRSYSQGVQARRQAQEEEERGEIERFVRAASTMPELASTWGQDLKKRLGSKYPELSPVVDTIQSKHTGSKAIQETAELAGKKFYDQWDGLWRRYQGLERQVEESPDTLPSIFGPIPNPHKLSSYAQLQKIDPARLPHLAASALPPSERHAALAWAKANYGQEIPDETLVDWFKTLPADQAGLYGLRQGLISDPTGELGQSLRVKTKLEQSPANLQNQGFQDQQRQLRAVDSRENLGVSDKLQRERAEEAYRRDLTKIDRRQGYTVSNMKLRKSMSESGDGENSPSLALWSPKDVLSLNKQEVSDWRNRMKDEASTGEDATDKAGKRKAYLKNNPQPPSLSDSEARAVSTIIKERSKGKSAEEALGIGEEVYRKYTEQKKLGKSGADALRFLKQEPELIERIKTAPSGPSRGGRRSARTGENKSSRPPVISSAEITRRIEAEVRRAEPDPQIRKKIIENVTKEYERLVASGMSPTQAIAEIEKE